jgi:hypothetical protein
MSEDEKHEPGGAQNQQSEGENKRGRRLGGVSAWTAVLGTVLAIVGTVHT